MLLKLLVAQATEGVAHSERDSGSVQSVLVALPHRNIHFGSVVSLVNDRTTTHQVLLVDIREWSPDHYKMGKGVTLTSEELKKLNWTSPRLRNLLNGMNP